MARSRRQATHSVRPALERLEERTLLNAGSMDPTFGTGGEVLTPLPNSTGVTGLVLQPDGKLVAGGTFGTNLVLVRYLSNGAQDATFGTGGAVTANLGMAGVVGVALQTDGKILVAGTTGNLLSNNLTIVVARYLPNGTLDSTFGSGGEASVGPGLTGNLVTLQADGKILVAGITLSFDTTIQALTVVRFNIDGTLDSTFGTNGRAQTFISGDAVPLPHGVGVQGNGRIVVTTSSELVGFTASGTLDAGFGAGGITKTPTPASMEGLTVLPDGRIVLVGVAQGAAGNSDFAILRYFANGILDASFGTNGETLTDFGQNEQATAVAVQPDGRYVAAGYSLNSSSVSTFALARYNPNGSLDTTFGTAGKVLTAFPAAASSMAHQVVVQADGRAVAAGNGDGNFALARYTQDTALPTANQRFVAQVYLDLLGRQVDGSGLAQWSAMLDQGVSRTQVVAQIETSQEFLTDAVNALYAQYLHRTADSGGLSGSINFLRSGGTVEQLVSILVSSQEFLQGQGKGTRDGFLDALYQDALNRAVDPAGRSGWDQALANGASFGQVATAILSSTEYHQDVVEEVYGLLLRRRADPTGLSNFTTFLNQGGRDETLIALVAGSQEYFNRV